MPRKDITEIMDVLKNLKQIKVNYRVFRNVSDNLYDQIEDIYEKERGNVFLKMQDETYKNPNFQANDTFYLQVLQSLEKMSNICEEGQDCSLFYTYVDKAICYLRFID